jgi:hypothetical protein
MYKPVLLLLLLLSCGVVLMPNGSMHMHVSLEDAESLTHGGHVHFGNLATDHEVLPETSVTYDKTIDVADFGKIPGLVKWMAVLSLFALLIVCSPRGITYISCLRSDALPRLQRNCLLPPLRGPPAFPS